MDDKIRTLLTAVAKTIMSTKNEPYLEIILPSTTDFSDHKWYEPLLVIRYTLIHEQYTQPGTFDPTKFSKDYKKVYLYEYERAYLRPSKAVNELKEYRSHNSCPACSSSMCTVKFMTNNEINKESSLLCVCERCTYKWLAKPNFIK